MQYKSVRSSSKVGFKKSISLTALSVSILSVCFGFFAQSSWALTITPVKSSTDNTSLTNVDQSQTAYFPTNGTGLDTGDDTVPSPAPTGTVTQATDPTGAHAMLFNITATTASYNPPSGATVPYSAFIMAFVNSTVTPGNYYPIPLAFYNNNPGNGGAYTSCQNNCYLTGTSYYYAPPTTTYYFAVPYTPNTTVQVGIYPSDICFLHASSQLSNSGANAVCSGTSSSGSGTFAPTAGQTEGFQIKFTVVLVPQGTGLQIAPQSTTDSQLTGASNSIATTSDTAPLFLSFQDKGGSINTASCPAQNTLYQPGDQSILLDTTAFQNIFIAPGSSGSGRVAPVNSILMTYAKSSTYNASPTSPSITYSSSDPIFARNIPFGNSSDLISGFANSTQANPVFYNMSLFMRDTAGYITTGNGCPLDNVEVAEIEAFLKQSKCFIATAAFRSMDAAPVAMLRQFRDQVLLHFGLGRGFVSWYYRWSPPAAEWLIENPEFRYPVLLALVPVEIIAWLCLRPLIFLGLSAMGLLLFVALRKRMNLRMRGESA